MGVDPFCLAQAVGYASGASLVVFHGKKNGQWHTASWVTPAFKELLANWSAPHWDEREPLLCRALDEGIVHTAPLAGLGSLSPEMLEQLQHRVPRGVILGSKPLPDIQLVFWLGFTAQPDQEQIRGLFELIDQLSSCHDHCGRAYLDWIPAVFIRVSMEGTILECNHFIEVMGYQREEVVGQEASFLFAPGERERLRHHLLQASPLRRFEAAMRHRSGEYLNIDLMAAVVFDDDHQPLEVVAIGRNLREEKKRDHQRRMEAVSRLVSGVAHELNNPLQTVLGNAEMLQEMKLPGAAQRRAVRVLVGARRCQDVVDGLLRLKLQQGEQDQEINLEHLVRRCLKTVKADFPSLSVAISLEIDQKTPTVLGEATDLEHAILNILNNAWHAVASESEPQIKIVLASVGKTVQLQIKDNGSGMSMETLERAFEPFFTTREVGGGRGLGLSIAQSIIQEHQGIIELRPEEQWMVVQITLPVANKV